MPEREVRGKCPVLLLVDPQRKFARIREDWQEAIRTGVEGMNRFIAAFRDAGAPVIFMRYIGPSHIAYDGDDGDEWLEGIDSGSDLVLDKPFMNSFRGTALEEELVRIGADTIVIAGMVTQACVISTYYSAFDHGFTPYLAKGAIIATEDAKNEAAEALCGMATLSGVERCLASREHRQGDVRL